MGVELSRQAEKDLESIFDYIQDISRKNADEFLDRFDAAIEGICKRPFAARLRDDEFPLVGLRVVRAAPALLIYRVRENGGAEIVRIAHERADLLAFLGPIPD